MIEPDPVEHNSCEITVASDESYPLTQENLSLHNILQEQNDASMDGEEFVSSSPPQPEPDALAINNGVEDDDEILLLSDVGRYFNR